jgi:hypothetical protein
VVTSVGARPARWWTEALVTRSSLAPSRSEVGSIARSPTIGARSLLVVALALLTTGCRLDVLAGADVRADGSGTAVVQLGLDEALLEELETLELDATAEIAAADAAPGWDVSRARGPDRELVVTLTREVAEPDGFSQVFHDLQSGLAAEDPALLVDLDVAVTDEGGASVVGSAELRAPETAGVTMDGAAVGPDRQRLQELVDEHVAASVAVTLPGRVTEHDGVLDGRTVRWDLDDGPVEFAATSTPPPWWSVVPPSSVAAAVVLTVAALLVVRWWRRRAAA